MGIEEQTILLVSDDADICEAARRELNVKAGRLRVAAVQNGLFLAATDSKGIRCQRCRSDRKKEKRQSDCRALEIHITS